MIKLYWSPRSRSFSAIWLLEETGLPYERVLTDISTGAQKAPEYLAVNPMGKVPGLKDGDAALGEASAICAYIADRYPETKLAPAATDPLRARYLQWLFFSPGCIEPALIQIFTKLEVPASTAAWGSAAQVFDALDAALQKGPWILGGRHHARLRAEFCGTDVQDGAATAVVRRLYRPLCGASGVPARGEDRGGVSRSQGGQRRNSAVPTIYRQTSS
jgi:glutathione S-transferase